MKIDLIQYLFLIIFFFCSRPCEFLFVYIDRTQIHVEVLRSLQLPLCGKARLQEAEPV